MITVDDVKLLKLNTFVDSEGSLVPIESNSTIPFEIKRSLKPSLSMSYINAPQLQSDASTPENHPISLKELLPLL